MLSFTGIAHCRQWEIVNMYSDLLLSIISGTGAAICTAVVAGQCNGS
jgi:hypothetical protein